MTEQLELDFREESVKLLSDRAGSGDIPGRILTRLASDSAGYIYMFGGMKNSRHDDLFVRFDMMNGTWEGVAENGGARPSARNAFAMERIGDQLIMAGGAGNTSCNAINVFNLGTMSWRRGPEYEDTGYGLGSAVIDGEFYFYGGNSDKDCVMRVYNPETDSIRKVGGKGPSNRFYFGMTAVGQRIYVLWGFHNQTDCHVFDTTTETWSLLKADNEPPRMHGFGCASAFPYLYCLGEGNTVYRLDTLQNEWKTAPVLSRNRLWSCMVECNGRMYVTGGGSAVLKIDSFRHDGQMCTAWSPETHSRCSSTFQRLVLLLLLLHATHDDLGQLSRELMYLILEDLYAQYCTSNWRLVLAPPQPPRLLDSVKSVFSRSEAGGELPALSHAQKKSELRCSVS